jgi:aconitate hydratase
VMIRGTFANVRVKNLMIPPDASGNRIEGGFTLKDGKQTTVYDAAMEYMAQGTPTIVLAGEEYGTGSSRDWAAKGTQLLGVKVVVARSYERIHRSNLVGMGVLPLQFLGSDSIQTLKLDGSETYDVTGLTEDTAPQAELVLRITRVNGEVQDVKVLSRIDTPIEVEYYKHRGILPFVLRELLGASQ